MEKYNLVLNKKQMEVVKDALELRFRIDLCQEYELADILAQMSADFTSDNPNRERIFNEYLQRKDHICIIIKALFEIARPKWQKEPKRNEDAMICEDIWQAIRYQLWKDKKVLSKRDKTLFHADGRMPLPCSEQPFPEITRVGRVKNDRKTGSN